MGIKGLPLDGIGEPRCREPSHFKQVALQLALIHLWPMRIPRGECGQELDAHGAVALGELIRGRDPDKRKRPHLAVPQECRRLRRDVLFCIQRHPLLTWLLSHPPVLFETNRANGCFAHHSCIAEIALHWFWQSGQVGVRNEHGLWLLALLQQDERFMVSRPFHGSFLPLSSRDVMTLRLWVTSICPLVQQHEASTSGQKMGVARRFRHFSTRASLPSHRDLHTLVSGRDPGTSVPTLSASRMGGLFIEDPDTCDGLSRAHFHHEATACRKSGYTARKNLPSCRTRRNSGSFPLTGSRCWNSISV